MHEDGVGVSVDCGRAVELFERARELGNEIAFRNLDTMYEPGKGVQLDLECATFLYIRSAELGDECAKLHIMVLVHWAARNKLRLYVTSFIFWRIKRDRENKMDRTGWMRGKMSRLHLGNVLEYCI